MVMPAVTTRHSKCGFVFAPLHRCDNRAINCNFLHTFRLSFACGWAGVGYGVAMVCLFAGVREEESSGMNWCACCI